MPRLSKVAAFSPLCSDDTSQPRLKTAALVKRLVLRHKIDMDDGDTARLNARYGLSHQRQPDAQSLPCWMHYHIDKHSVSHSVADDGAPCHEFTVIVKSAHSPPVTLQSGGIIVICAIPANGLA